MTPPLKQTPLHSIHRELGAKLVEFGGWDMPVQYSSIVDEHLCVRRACGLFDISHMGELLVSGSPAREFLNRQLTNDTRRLVEGMGQYTLMCNPSGGVIDDLYAYQIGPSDFLLIVNASRIEADAPWLISQAPAELEVRNVSEEFGAVAIQGPRTIEFISRIFPGPSTQGARVPSILELKKNQIGQWPFEDRPVWAARTGYSGEDGFELFAPADRIATLWNRILAAGHVACLQPCGLGARDTLRTEVCYPLYGHEIDENTTPIEAGLSYFVSFDKGEFNGRQALLDQKNRGPSKKLVCFKMTGKSPPPRPGYPIHLSAEGSAPIGAVVSGTQSPSLNLGIGLGYVSPDHSRPETPITIEIRGRPFPARVVPKPFYKKAV